MKPFIKKFEEVSMKNVSEVGGKNASLGEMIQNLVPKGINIPSGYVITASAYRYFLQKTDLKKFIKKTIQGLDTRNLHDLARCGKLIREAIKQSEFPKDLTRAIITAHRRAEKKYGKNADFAVRSSATAEDMPGASFAGQMETYLNVRGEENILKAVRAAMASLFTNRAISYRKDKGFDHFKVALSVGVQKMVRSDLSCSGVLFTLDTESGFPDLVLINGSWGLGEMIVQGEVTPDEFLVFKKTGAIIGKELGMKRRKMIYGKGNKPTKVISTSQKERESFILSDNEISQLAKWGMLVEEHYSKRNKGKWTPMDLEWAKDGKTKEMFVVQARPETVHALRDFSKIKEYKLVSTKPNTINPKPIVIGASVGSKIAVGKARVILDTKKIKEFKAGEVLVTGMTDPDWEPIMKIASAIVTDKGGRTSHAAIVSRELGIPCIVGSETATKKIKTGQTITVDTTGSDGFVYDGALKFKITEHNVKKIPKPKTKIMMNIATPETAFEKSFLPNEGVGLAREEFIIASDIGIHPMAIIEYQKLKNSKLKAQINKKTIGWKDKKQFYIDKLAFGIAKIAAAFYPKQVIVRFSDFKTNEYRSLVGGEIYEPVEENPMLGWRGASRYYHPNFAPAFVLEVKAIKKVRENMGLDNVEVMIPFCRTVEEGKKVLQIMAKNGLKTKSSKLKTYVMCEIPSNVVLADEFLKVFDGMSIGSNDLTQLTVGIDRDGNEQIRSITNEKDESVKKLIAEVIKKCLAKKKYIGICGQAPSDFPEFAEFLVEHGIESISLNPDTVVKTTQKIYQKEKKLRKK
ncbi:MAG: phosphoenolpyruvate synthase [Candidatus Paceibacterota bacterium]